MTTKYCLRGVGSWDLWEKPFKSSYNVVLGANRNEKQRDVLGISEADNKVSFYVSWKIFLSS